MKIYTFILAALLAAGGPLCTSTVFIALDVTTVTLNPGETFTFSGAVTNDVTSTVDLNNINVTLDGSLFQVDPTPFFSGPPTVAAGTSTPSFTLFSVTVELPYTAAPGIQTDTLTILGGADAGGIYDPTVQDFLGSVPFNVNVVSPEPSTFAMMTPAILAGMGLVLHKRKKRRL